MKIYTKTGDKGTTSLLGGTRVNKEDARIEAYGTVDELNAFLGLLRDHVSAEELKNELLDIQHVLFVIGSHLACEKETLRAQLPVFKEHYTQRLEEAIDRMNEALPAMTQFILPGGHPSVSHCHVARTVCRRAERRLTTLHHLLPQDLRLIAYLNRLADYLFVLARYLGHLQTVPEIFWDKNRP